MNERAVFYPRSKEPGRTAETNHYIKILGLVEQVCKRYHLNHRFVGGSFTDFLGIDTNMTVDSTSRKIYLRNPNAATIKYSNKYIKDIDLLTFTEDKDYIIQAKRDLGTLADEARRKYNYQFPRITVKSVSYPEWEDKSTVKEFLSSFLSSLYVNRERKLFIGYCDIFQQIPWVTAQPWKLKLDEDTEITTFYPHAHALTYGLFIPGGFRKKDRQIKTDCKTGRQFSKFSVLFSLA